MWWLRYAPQLMIVVAVSSVAACQDRSDPLHNERSTGPGFSEAGRDDDGDAAAVNGAFQAVDIRLALRMDADVDASQIDVDVDHAARVVSLRGAVSTSAQRARAEEVVHNHVDGYRIDNQLDVRTTP
jgi:osmotically-inducible protein OsmY